MLILVIGLPLSGKTTTALKLEKLIDKSLLLDTELVRGEVTGGKPPKFTEDEAQKVWKLMHSRAKTALENGKTVIWSQPLSKRLSPPLPGRVDLVKLAKESKSPLAVLLCMSPENIILGRIADRPNETHPYPYPVEVYYRIRDNFDPVELPNFVVKTDRVVDYDGILNYLESIKG